MKNIKPVIVIYNTNCADSTSVQAMVSQGLPPLIVDNSTKDYGNRSYCEMQGLEYIDMHGNAGLSKAYNRALDHIGAYDGYILWLDDDTIIPGDFIGKMRHAIMTDSTNKVYVPIVKSKGTGYLSPNIIKKLKTFRINDIKAIGTNTISAINSGMLVYAQVYSDYRYDENLFLDCIDHDFMLYCQKKNIPIQVVREAELFQNFSGDESSGLKKELVRFSIYKKDFKEFRKKHGATAFTTEALLLKRFISIIMHCMVRRKK